MSTAKDNSDEFPVHKARNWGCCLLLLLLKLDELLGTSITNNDAVKGIKKGDNIHHPECS